MLLYDTLAAPWSAEAPKDPHSKKVHRVSVFTTTVFIPVRKGLRSPAIDATRVIKESATRKRMLTCMLPVEERQRLREWQKQWVA